MKKYFQVIKISKDKESIVSFDVQKGDKKVKKDAFGTHKIAVQTLGESKKQGIFKIVEIFKK